MLQKKRSFKIYAVSKHDNKKTKFREGRYIARDPATAAKKAFNQLCRLKRIKGQCVLQIAMQETTAGSNKKIYKYRARRYKLSTPKVFKKDTPGEYTIIYDSHIHTDKLFDFVGSQKGYKSRGRMKKSRKQSKKKSPTKK
tara:strand:- start:91 stop:510 length:420 start_codon:yes stop_codon:yes gene_type:complete